MSAEAELAAVRHKMQFRPGAFSGMGISNGIPPKSSGGKGEEARERTLPNPSTGVELEDLLRERERRIREREGGIYDLKLGISLLLLPGCMPGGAHQRAVHTGITRGTRASHLKTRLRHTRDESDQRPC